MMLQQDAEKIHFTPDVVLENFAEGILILDADGYVQYSNHAVARILGYTRADLDNQSLHVIYGDNEERIRCAAPLRSRLICSRVDQA